MAKMDVKPLFIDTNILVYASVKESPFHEQALTALETAYNTERPLWISRQIIREFLVIMTRPQAFETLSKETVLQQANDFCHRFNVADDTSNVTKELLSLLKQFPGGGKQVHDMNIVAAMLANGITHLLTHNVKDFKRFENTIALESLLNE